MVRRGKRGRIDWSDIETPCVKICKIIDNNCIGCYRTAEEIRDWVWMTPEERSKIIKEIQLNRYQVSTNN
tara:strand:+ start:739 stop:948 length:210 start_codon:yes stop_codon:yes gene_type:complete